MGKNLQSMIEIKCDISGNPEKAIPSNTIAKIQKGTSIFCYDNMQEYLTDLQIKLPPNPQEVARQQVGAYVDRLNIFCDKFINDMKVENIMLGISQEKPEMVDALTTKTEVILKHIGLGSLKVAIAAIREFPEAELDAKYLTKTRLTAKRNEIHAFLGIPLVQNYND